MPYASKDEHRLLGQRECPGQVLVVLPDGRTVKRDCGTLISYNATRCSHCGMAFATGALTAFQPAHAKAGLKRDWVKRFLRG